MGSETKAARGAGAHGGPMSGTRGQEAAKVTDFKGTAGQVCGGGVPGGPLEHHRAHVGRLKEQGPRQRGKACLCLVSRAQDTASGEPGWGPTHTLGPLMDAEPPPNLGSDPSQTRPRRPSGYSYSAPGRGPEP